MDSNKIECKLCAKICYKKQFSYHLKSCHNKNYYEYVCQYLEYFPNWKKCCICSKITNKKMACSKKCSIEWRKTLIGKKSPHFGIKHTKKTKLKIGKSQKKRLSIPKNKLYLLGHCNSSCRPEVRKKISKTRIDRKVSKGKKNGMYGKTHTASAIKKILSHRKMNGLEKIVAGILDSFNLKYHFQYFISENGVCKSYDFKIKGKPFIIECDGDFWHGNPNAKYHWKNSKLVQENDIIKEEMAKKRGLFVIRIWQSELKSNPAIFIDRLKENNLINN